MERHAPGAEDGPLAWFEDGGGWLEEEERFLGADVVELFDVVSLGVSVGSPQSSLGADSGDTHSFFQCRRLCGNWPRCHEKPL